MSLFQGHTNPLKRRGRDSPASLPSSTQIISNLIKQLIHRNMDSLAIVGESGTGKATIVSHTLQGLTPTIKNTFTNIIWIETLTSSVANLQHNLMQWILESVPDLRKIASNDGIKFSPPTNVQEGQTLLRKMIIDASAMGHSFFYVLNECYRCPFLPEELGLCSEGGKIDQTTLLLTNNKAVANVCATAIVMPPMTSSKDTLALFQSYDENIYIVPMLAGQTQEEEKELQSNLILERYKLAIRGKTNQASSKKISKATEQAAELERVDILVEICNRPLTCTMAAGALRHAERWSKKTVKSSLENFLHRIERRLQ